MKRRLSEDQIIGFLREARRASRSRSCVGGTGSLRPVTDLRRNRFGGSGITSHSGVRLSSGLTGWCISPMTMAGPSAVGESGQRGRRARSPNPTLIPANQIRHVLMRRWPARNTGPHQEVD